MQLQQPWDERRCFTGREHAPDPVFAELVKDHHQSASTSTVPAQSGPERLGCPS